MFLFYFFLALPEYINDCCLQLVVQVTQVNEKDEPTGNSASSPVITYGLPTRMELYGVVDRDEDYHTRCI